MSIMNEVVICSALRTAIGSFQGQWAQLSAPELAAEVIKSIVTQTRVLHIDECILGCVLTAGVGQAPARQALLKSGLSNRIPCTTVNKVCGSAMKAVAMAYDSIAAGNARVVLAGGMESMSRAPHLIRSRQNKKMGHHQLIDHLF
ncbi:3-ketoacyl-CoA thiolase @ Acetyl-CoA acetyltransferase, partial [hydrothermal vent metagenome]